MCVEACLVAGKPILVPLTTSLYVPGKLSDPEHVVVDVGTGYYVKKVRPSTIVEVFVDADTWYGTVDSRRGYETLPKKGRLCER